MYDYLKNQSWLLFIISTTFFSSCSDDEVAPPENIIFTKIELIKNDRHIISYQEENEYIRFFFDLIEDTSNEINGEWPHVDFFTIYSDYNTNGNSDYNVDRTFSAYKEKVCKSYILPNNAKKLCDYSSGATEISSFSSTENQQEDHPNFEILIPKTELSNSDKAHVTFNIFESGKGYYYYPSGFQSLYFYQNYSKTIEINW